GDHTAVWYRCIWLYASKMILVKSGKGPYSRMVFPIQPYGLNSERAEPVCMAIQPYGTALVDPYHEINDSLVFIWMYYTISPKLVDMVIDDSVTACKIEGKAARLANLGSEVSDSSLVTYAINGIRVKFPEISLIIRPWEPLPMFDMTRFMMLLEENEMLHQTSATSSFHNSSPSPTTMMLHDPTWHMDMGASSHLAGNTGLPDSQAPPPL
nr:dehydrogenase, E1 component [Tanacetum cinerariifolium]